MKKTNLFQNAAKTYRTNKVRADRVKVNKLTKSTAKIKNKFEKRTTILKSKAKAERAKLQYFKDKGARKYQELKSNAMRGGLTGHIARNRLKKMSKTKADIEINEMAPKLKSEEFKTKLQTDADVKKTKAKGAAYSAVGSAVAGGYAMAEESKSRAKIAQAEADIKAVEAIQDSVASVGNVDEDGKPVRSGKVTGLVTGVR